MGAVFSPPARWGLLDFMSVACSSPRPPRPLLVLLLNCDPRRTVFSVGPQPRPSMLSVPCRTSTTTIPAQCSLPDLNHDHPRPVFPAGPQPRVSTPKDMPHRVPEDMPDRMLEDMPDRMPEGMPDRMPERMSDRMPEDMPDKVPECLPDRMPADLPDNMPEDMLDRMPERMSDRMPDNMPEDMPDRMPDGMPEEMPEHMPEDMPEHLPDIPEHLPEEMPGRMPEDMPDRMPDRMPENMSDRMPEDLPVTKCINVMVGITRSKVILVFDDWSVVLTYPNKISVISTNYPKHSWSTIAPWYQPPRSSLVVYPLFLTYGVYIYNIRIYIYIYNTYIYPILAGSWHVILSKWHQKQGISTRRHMVQHHLLSHGDSPPASRVVAGAQVHCGASNGNWFVSEV